MKTKVAKVISAIARNAARVSVNATSDWRHFQPKVPTALIKSEK